MVTSTSSSSPDIGCVPADRRSNDEQGDLGVAGIELPQEEAALPAVEKEERAEFDTDEEHGPPKRSNLVAIFCRTSAGALHSHTTTAFSQADGESVKLSTGVFRRLEVSAIFCGLPCDVFIALP